jgi:hypothetical protein
MSDKEPEIDPIEIEINLLNELIEDNIIIVIHRNGMSIMMNEDKEERTQEQMRLFSRLYVASNPSFVLRFFLILEVGMLLISEYLEDFYNSKIKKR